MVSKRLIVLRISPAFEVSAAKSSRARWHAGGIPLASPALDRQVRYLVARLIQGAFGSQADQPDDSSQPFPLWTDFIG